VSELIVQAGPLDGGEMGANHPRRRRAWFVVSSRGNALSWRWRLWRREYGLTALSHCSARCRAFAPPAN